ncbi:hypothetical protein BC941DRAFT_448345 [Chlamydoabsidia padenii]|nr:hypothetical protein BC941DRAFT_448345 [Chlamydoabsidia padenii]
MNVGANRLDTFLNYQPLWPYINNTNYHSPEEFVNAGFYNVSTKRMIDKVQCYLCDITLADWKQEQSPLDRHTLTSTQCPLVILNFFDNSMTSLDNDAYPESEHMLKARLKTFTKNTTWPPLDITSNTQRRRTTRSSSRQKVIPSAEKMAEAGFIFTPTLDCPDRVKCPYCQYHLGDLQNTINPWLLHEQSNPSCLFVTRRRSNMRLKSSLVLQKRGLIPEISSRRRSATNASTKTTPKTQDGSVNSTEKGNSCHGGGNGGNPATQDVNKDYFSDHTIIT